MLKNTESETVPNPGNKLSKKNSRRVRIFNSFYAAYIKYLHHYKPLHSYQVMKVSITLKKLSHLCTTETVPQFLLFHFNCKKLIY